MIINNTSVITKEEFEQHFPLYIDSHLPISVLIRVEALRNILNGKEPTDFDVTVFDPFTLCKD